MSGVGVGRGLIASTHPGPTVVVTALVAALAVAAGLEPWRAVVLVAAVFAGQVSVGLSNDAIDAERDRVVGRRDKPIAAGVVDVRLAMGTAVGAVVLAVVLSFVLGPAFAAAHSAALAGAWLYNLSLKATPLSIVPFIVSFALLPSFPTLATTAPVVAAGWAWIAGASLGAAVHLTNVLPDLDDDRRTSIRGLPHRLGARASAVLAVVALLGGAVAVLIGPALSQGRAVSPIGGIFFGVAVLLAVVTLVRAVTRPPDRTIFRLVMLTALVLAAQLVATGSALAG